MKKKISSKSKRNQGSNKEMAQTKAQIQAVMNKVPVMIVLRDGSCYCGMIRETQGQDILFEGVKGSQALHGDSASARAQISSLGGLGSLFGMGSGLGGLLGGSKGGGFLGSFGGLLKIGMGMLSFIMPLMGGFGI